MQLGSLKEKLKTALETLEMGFQEESIDSGLNQRLVFQGPPADSLMPQGLRVRTPPYWGTVRGMVHS